MSRLKTNKSSETQAQASVALEKVSELQVGNCLRTPQHALATKAPRKPKTKWIFKQFSRFPAEIRLRIWRYMIVPRTVRAVWDHESSESDGKCMFRLRGGRVPSVLHINSESRHEAKKHYCLVRSDMPKDGAYWGIRKERQIFIDYTIDTIYFVGKFPSGPEFLEWIRNLNKGYGLNQKQVLRQIALPFYSIQKLASFSRMDFIYNLVAQHPHLQEILIVFEHSSFGFDRRPDKYRFVFPSHLSSKFPKTKRAELQSQRFKLETKKILAGYWIKPKGTTENLKAFKKFKERYPEWQPPVFKMVALKKKTTMLPT